MVRTLMKIVTVCYIIFSFAVFESLMRGKVQDKPISNSHECDFCFKQAINSNSPSQFIKGDTIGDCDGEDCRAAYVRQKALIAVMKVSIDNMTKNYEGEKEISDKCLAVIGVGD